MEKIDPETIEEEISILKDQSELCRRKLAGIHEKMEIVRDELSDCAEDTQRVVRTQQKIRAEIEELRASMVQFGEDNEVKSDLSAQLVEIETLEAQFQSLLAASNTRTQELSDRQKNYQDTMDNLKDELRKLEVRLERVMASRDEIASAVSSTASSVRQAE